MRQTKHTCTSSGILTRCPSTSPFGYALGPTNPGPIIVALETLGMRWSGFSPDKFVTHANILTSICSILGYPFTSLRIERSSTGRILLLTIRAFYRGDGQLLRAFHRVGASSIGRETGAVKFNPICRQRIERRRRRQRSIKHLRPIPRWRMS